MGYPQLNPSCYFLYCFGAPVRAGYSSYTSKCRKYHDFYKILVLCTFNLLLQSNKIFVVVRIYCACVKVQSTEIY
jgi:hypothetical protein